MLSSLHLPCEFVSLPHVLQVVPYPYSFGQLCPEAYNMPGLLVLASRSGGRSGVLLVSDRLGIIDRERIYRTFHMPVTLISLSCSPPHVQPFFVFFFSLLTHVPF